MKTDDLKKFLLDNYEYAKDEMKAKNGKMVKVFVRSVSGREGSPFLKMPKIKIDNNNPVFYFFGETEKTKNDKATYIKDAINDPNVDYIVSIEPFETGFFTNQKVEVTLSNLDFEGVLSEAEQHGEIGIYSKELESQYGVKYNLVMIRVKEDGKLVTKYLDAYLASSDSRTYKDIKYTIGLFSKNQNISLATGNESPWPHNLLIFGAPGTGKSHSIDEKIKKLGWETNMHRVTFYEDYSYEKFVGAYLPYMGPKISQISGKINDGLVELNNYTEKSIEYRFVPGVFLQMIVDAWFSNNSDNAEKYVLVIEEINRANAAAVFGDFFQLLDRDKDGVSDYSITLSDDMQEWIRTYLFEKLNSTLDQTDRLNYKSNIDNWLSDFKLPSNLYIWATMNSADQGVYPMDAAFKRRWSYLYKSTEESSGRKLLIKWKT